MQNIDDIKNAPDTTRNIKVDLRTIEPVLRHLNMAFQGGDLKIFLNTETRSAVDNCDRACKAFQASLDYWMRHSTGDKTFWMNRWRAGLFGQEKTKTLKGQLNDCKNTLGVALSTASILMIIRQEFLLKDIRDIMLQQNEVSLQRQIDQAVSRGMGIVGALQRLSDGGSIQQSEESERSRQELFYVMQQQKTSNDTLQKMCEEALSRTVYERTGQKIKGVKATNNSAAPTGTFISSGEDPKIDQDISDVTADNWSFAPVGYFKGMDFKDLWPKGPAQ